MRKRQSQKRIQEPAAAARPGRAQAILLATLLLCATLAAFSPAYDGGQLWDDAGHITRPEMRSAQGLYRTWFDLGSTAQYYPLLHTAFWMEHRLWGDSTFGYHVINALLHAAAALLVVAMLKRLQLRGAWLAGFLFALHPVAVESVSWMSEQKNTLSAVFYLGSALLYLRFDETRRKRLYFGAFALFVCALLSKSVTATLPFALLVVFWWKRGRVELQRDALPLAPWMALGIPSGLFTAWVERVYVGAHGSDFALSALERCLLAGRVAWFYLQKNLLPFDLIFIYPRWRVEASALWFGCLLAALAALGALGWLAWKRSWRGPLAAALFFLGSLAPVLGFLNVYPFLYSYVADHFQYLARLGVIVPLAWALAMAADRLPALYARLGAVALCAALAVLTWKQAAIYVDADTHYAATLAANPEAWLAHNNLGSDLLDTPGRFDEGLAHVQAALRIYPNSPMAHYNLARALQRQGRMEEAVAEFRTSVKLQSNLPMVHDSLGQALGRVGRLEEAIAEHRIAIEQGPSFPQFHNNLGTELARLGRIDEAAEEFRRAIAIEPAYAEAHNNLGLALFHQKDLGGALYEFGEAVRLNPTYAPAHSNLGSVLLQTGRTQEAEAQFEAALQAAPDYAPAQQALARLRGGM